MNAESRYGICFKKEGCDMKVAKEALDIAMAQGDVVIEVQLNGTGDN